MELEHWCPYSSSFIISTMIQRFAERLRNAIAEKINRVPLNILIAMNKEIPCLV